MPHPGPGSMLSSQVKRLNLSINSRPRMFTRCYVHASAGECDAVRSRPVTMRRMTPGKAKPGLPGTGRQDVAPARAGISRSRADLADANVIFRARVNGPRIWFNQRGTFSL